MALHRIPFKPADSECTVPYADVTMRPNTSKPLGRPIWHPDGHRVRAECKCGEIFTYTLILSRRIRNVVCTRCARPDPSHELYSIYTSLLSRKDIAVCVSWRLSWLDFIEDISPRPSPKHRLTRRYPTQQFSRTNFRWATIEDINDVFAETITLSGESHTIRQWAELLGWTYSQLRYRINHMPIKDALTNKPLRAVATHVIFTNHSINPQCVPPKYAEEWLRRHPRVKLHYVAGVEYRLRRMVQPVTFAQICEFAKINDEFYANA